MPERLTLLSEMMILPSFSLPIWSINSSAAASKPGGAPRARVHLIDHLDIAERGVGGFQQFALAGGQRRAAAQRDPDHVALGRPDERLGFGNEAGFVVDQPHAGHGFDRSHRAAAAVFRECIGGKGDVAAVDRDLLLVQHGILERGGRCARPDRFPEARCVDQAAIAQRIAKGIVPGHHLLLHLKSPCIRRPAVWEPRENKPLRGCQTGNNREWPDRGSSVR